MEVRRFSRGVSFLLLTLGLMFLFSLDLLGFNGLGRHFEVPTRILMFGAPVVQALSLAAAVYFWGNRIGRAILFVGMAWFLLFECADVISLFILDSHLSTNLLLILYGSSPEEVARFLGNYDWWLPVVLVIVWLVSLLVFGCFMRHIDLCCRSRWCIALLCSFLYFCTWCDDGRGTGFFCYTSFFTSAVRDTVIVADQAKMSHSPNYDIKFEHTENHSPIGLFVIGESVTRNHLGLYGYSRNTTPGLCSRAGELFVFKDVIGSNPYTQVSIRNLLTQATIEDPNSGRVALPEVLTRLGFDTWLISSQTRWGRTENIVSLLFTQCKERHYLTETHKQKSLYDEALLPYVDRFLAHTQKEEKGGVAFLHMAGSHFPWNVASPSSRQKFDPDMVDDVTSGLSAHVRRCVNYYDNSIAYTDAILTNLIGKLEKIARPSFLVFVPDHGESPDTGVERKLTDMNVWEIPLIVWLSPEYRMASPDVVAALKHAECLPLQSDQLFHGFLSLAFVRECDETGVQSRNFLSDQFVLRKIRKIRGGKYYGEGL